MTDASVDYLRNQLTSVAGLLVDLSNRLYDLASPPSTPTTDAVTERIVADLRSHPLVTAIRADGVQTDVQTFDGPAHPTGGGR